jgi:16S rRNA processing protein RimM
VEVYIGKVFRTKGIKGEILTYFYSDKLIPKEGEFLFFERFGDKIGPFKIVKNIFYKFYKNREIFILKLESIDSLDEAEKLKSTFIVKEFEVLPEGIFLKKDLLNSQVWVEKQNRFIGRVVDVINVKAGYNLLMVKSKKSKEEFFIPFIKEVISNVDIENKKIFVNLIDGIVDVI